MRTECNRKVFPGVSFIAALHRTSLGGKKKGEFSQPGGPESSSLPPNRILSTATINQQDPGSSDETSGQEALLDSLSTLASTFLHPSGCANYSKLRESLGLRQRLNKSSAGRAGCMLKL